MASKAEFCSASSTSCSSETVQSMKAGMKPRRAILVGRDEARMDSSQRSWPGFWGFGVCSLLWVMQDPGSGASTP